MFMFAVISCMWLLLCTVCSCLLLRLLRTLFSPQVTGQSVHSLQSPTLQSSTGLAVTVVAERSAETMQQSMLVSIWRVKNLATLHRLVVATLRGLCLPPAARRPPFSYRFCRKEAEANFSLAALRPYSLEGTALAKRLTASAVTYN